VQFAYLYKWANHDIFYLRKGVITVGGKTSAASKNKWNAKAYDRITLCVPKGYKETLRKRAEMNGLSLNAFIMSAVIEAMLHDADTKQPAED